MTAKNKQENISLPELMDLILTPASTEDIALIGQMADNIWHEHYPDIISNDQINYMLNRMYDPESIKKQMTEEGCTFYLVKADDVISGFISVSQKAKGHFFLHKFYMAIRGKGAGSAAFSQLLELLQPESVTLTVNRKNYKSINFYFKNGFIIKEVADFDIGNGYVMNDFVMLWQKPHR